MDTIKLYLDRWPTDDAGLPVLRNTSDAFKYGRLIAGNDQMKAHCQAIRKFFVGAAAWDRKHERWQDALDYACQAQFFREALEEAQRIEDCIYYRNSNKHANRLAGDQA